MPEDNNEERRNGLLDCRDQRINDVVNYTKELINHFRWAITAFLTIISLAIGIVSFFLGPEVIKNVAEGIVKSKVEEIAKGMVEMELKELREMMPDIIDETRRAIKQEELQEKKPMEPTKEIKKTLEQLIKELQHDNWRVREAAAETLGKMGDPRAIEPLVSALEGEKDHDVINALKKALEKFKQ